MRNKCTSFHVGLPILTNSSVMSSATTFPSAGNASARLRALYPVYTPTHIHNYTNGLLADLISSDLNEEIT